MSAIVVSTTPKGRGWLMPVEAATTAHAPHATKLSLRFMIGGFTLVQFVRYPEVRTENS
jgi:hypothetical protein